MATPPKPGIFKSITGALDDIVKEVKQDLREMTPPASGKPRPDTSALGETVRSAAAGLSHIDVGGDEPAPAFDALSLLAPKMTNPWSRLETPGHVRVDAGFICAGADDGLAYASHLMTEQTAPYTLGIVLEEAARLEDPDNALGRLMGKEPRLFGAAAFGPRSLADDLDDLDERLTALLNANPKLIAVGLLALDEPYAPYTLPQQVRQLELQLDIARDFNLPAFIGHRRSLGPLAQCLLSAESLPPLVWADPLAAPEELELVKELNMSVLIRAELTHAANTAYRELLLQVPENKRLLGGGSALVAAESRSGHRNGPEALPHILKAYTGLLGREGDSAQKEQLEILNRNAQRLFYKPENQS